MSEPTIEELQAQIAQLQESMDKSNAELTELKSKNSELTDGLNKSRELNAQLLLRVPVTETEQPVEESETLDDVVADIVEDMNQRYIAKFT